MSYLTKSRAIHLGVFLLALAASEASAQNSGATLTLEQAQELARNNNPLLHQRRNDITSAGLSVRTAKGALLPSLSASLGTSFQQGGRQVFSGAELGANSDVIQSSYSIGLSWRFNAASILNPRIQAASRDAVESSLDGEELSTQTAVTQHYILVLQAEERAALQDTLIKSAQLQLDLARARVGVGSGIPLDTQRALVSLVQAQVARIRAVNQVQIEKLQLFQQLGVPLRGDVRLTTTFEMLPPQLELPALIQLALERNPTLSGMRARERAAELSATRARTEYLPSLSLSTGLGGYTYQYRDPNYLVQRARSSLEGQRASCFTTDSIRTGAGLPGVAAQCEALVFTDQMEAAIRAGNRQFPFDFTSSPRGVSVGVSLPIFDGFGREQRVAEAAIALDNLRNSVRSEELAIETNVTVAYLTMTSSLEAARLQQLNAARARAELDLVLERYRVGAATIVEVTDSRALYEQAESDRINAVFEFHKAVAGLEAFVGQSIR